MKITENAYMGYDGKIHLDGEGIIISLWNKLIDIEGGTGSKVFPNGKEFFENTFENPYDAAWAVSTGNYRWTDKFVYASAEGHLMSFNRLDDDTCPIDLGRIDISSLSSLISELQDLENKKPVVVNNISPAIHDALQEI